MEQSPQVAEQERRLARLGREEDIIMSGTQRAIALITVAIAALAPAIAAAAAASGHPVRARPGAVPAHVRVTATIAVGSQPVGVATDLRTSRICVARDGGDTVSVISGRTDTAAATVPVGRVPAGVATDPRTRPSGCGARGAEHIHC